MPIKARVKTPDTKYQFQVPKNAKIADITHEDTNMHTLDLAAALGETRKIVSVWIRAQRMGASTGFLLIYPNEGATYMQQDNTTWIVGDITIANGTQRLQYALSVSGDDFDVFCMRYIVEV